MCTKQVHFLPVALASLTEKPFLLLAKWPPCCRLQGEHSSELSPLSSVTGQPPASWAQGKSKEGLGQLGAPGLSLGASLQGRTLLYQGSPSLEVTSLCPAVLEDKAGRGGVSSHALPNPPVLPSFITFRSCAYLDKKHTIFGR